MYTLSYQGEDYDYIITDIKLGGRGEGLTSEQSRFRVLLCPASPKRHPTPDSSFDSVNIIKVRGAIGPCPFFRTLIRNSTNSSRVRHTAVHSICISASVSGGWR